MAERRAGSLSTGGSVEVGGRASRTIACRRRQPASAALPLPGAPDAWRSALYTSHQDAFNQVLMLDCCYEERLEVDAINQALRLSSYPHIRDVYNAERWRSGAGAGSHRLQR